MLFVRVKVYKQKKLETLKFRINNLYKILSNLNRKIKKFYCNLKILDKKILKMNRLLLNLKVKKLNIKKYYKIKNIYNKITIY